MLKEKTNNNSHLTAITRNKLSAPLQLLVDYNEFVFPDKILDYGCGKGTDADIIGADKYDPYFFPNRPENNDYDVVYCNYVLNVIEDEKERKNVIRSVLNAMHSSGTAFFIVRDDIKKEGHTSKGTWQGTINLDEYMPIWMYKKGKFKIYTFSFHYWKRLEPYIKTLELEV